MRSLLAIVTLGFFATMARAQFVFPRAEDHSHEPDLYYEDPFIVQYRQKFFSVFHGDLATFRKAYGEIAQMVDKNPNDSRALVWLGNGQTIEAALKLLKGERVSSLKELETSRRNLNQAVSLRPYDPNIFMMRAATLYIQGQYWQPKDLPAIVWSTLRDDCNHLIRYLGPAKMAKVSVHVRGETYGELGIAYKNLGDVPNAQSAFNKVRELCPNTPYALKASKEIAALKT